MLLPNAYTQNNKHYDRQTNRQTCGLIDLPFAARKDQIYLTYNHSTTTGSKMPHFSQNEKNQCLLAKYSQVLFVCLRSGQSTLRESLNKLVAVLYQEERQTDSHTNCGKLSSTNYYVSITSRGIYLS